MELSHRSVARVISILFLNLLSTSTHSAAISGQGTWESTLLARDFDGNMSTVEAYYDTVLGITWLADANYAGTVMTWATANSWSAGLNINGISGWRLPTMIDTGTSGCSYSTTGGTDCGFNVQTTSDSTAYSEMSSMFYDTLGNLAYFDTSGNPLQPGWGLSNTGVFSGLQPDTYWSATGYPPNPGAAWNFNFNEGFQNLDINWNEFYAWGVHDGDVGAAIVPVPAVVWLFGSGLLVLAGMARRNQTA